MNEKKNKRVTTKKLVYGICLEVNLENEKELKDLADKFDSMEKKYTKLIKKDKIKEEDELPMFRIMVASRNIKAISEAFIENKSVSFARYLKELILSLKMGIQD